MMKEQLNTKQLAHLQAILSQWQIPPVIAITPLYEGHPVFKVTTTDPTFVLKDISDAPDLTRLAFTYNVLTHVARTGLRFPIPLPTRTAQFAAQNENRYYLLTEFIEAGDYPTDPAHKTELFYHTGQAIATLHQALATYPDPEVRSKTWCEDLAGRIANWITALSEGLPAQQAAIIKRVGTARGSEIEAALRGLPEQLIHRDCHPGNVLVQGTQVVGFIDCDHLCIGPRLFDIAYYAVHHVKWVTNDETATRVWLNDLPHLLNGYQSLSRLTAAELAAFPYAMMAYHLLLAHWFMSNGYYDFIELEVQALDWIERISLILSIWRRSDEDNGD